VIPENNKFYVAYRLQFFAKEGPGGEKTEEATTKKLDDARKEGQVARSQELITAAGLLALFLVVKTFAGYMASGFLDSFSESYKEIETLAKEEITYQIGTKLLNQMGITILQICFPVFIAGVLVAFVVNIFQVKWKITGKPLQPKFNKINPLSGFKKMLSMDKVMELVKSIIKVGIIIYIVYDALKDQLGNLYLLYEMGNLDAIIVFIGDIVLDLGIKISVLFLIVGFADFIYQKLKFKKDMRMTKQEIKDEYKQQEGDPQVKSKIKQKMRQASQRRMMQRLPEADVVITNPTHFACALKYDKEVSDAPILIAKGADLLAAKIKEVAKENKIPIVENKPLARMLYYNVDIESEVPQELYQMVAEVLAYVYSLKT
jgi:flagellar biosynthetic protein FlhB